jgi:uncharacterized protein (DUF433 family)
MQSHVCLYTSSIGTRSPLDHIRAIMNRNGVDPVRDSVVKGSVRDAIAQDPYRTGGAHTIAETARLAGTSYQNVRRWVTGYESPGHRMEPVFGAQSQHARDHEPLMVSFLQLLEIVVAAKFRGVGSERTPVSLERIRQAHSYARSQLGLEYPFAHLRLRQEGGHILHDFDEQEPGRGSLVLSAGGQWVLPDVVLEEFDEIDFDGNYAEKWFPFGRSVSIVLNPRIAGGGLTFDETGVTVHTIHGRFKAGETIAHLARNYSLKPSAIERALQYAA